MVTMQDLKRAVAISGKEVGKEFVDYNTKCNKIIDIIYDKVIELMSKDTKVNPIKKKAVVKGAIYIKEPIKEYIAGMPKEDAKDVMLRVLEIVKK